MSFLRRVQSFPGAETITAIEGVIIVDAPQPGSIQGTGTGTVGITGEFQDVSSAVAVDVNGNVTTKPKPVEIFSGQDLANKFGGFDPTLGEFGVSGGNGFVALRNKKFSRLVAVAVNNASPLGIRVWRTLPTNVSATSAVPVVPMQAATVNAGTEFKSGANRARLAKLFQFTDDAAYDTGTDGTAVPAGLPLATQLFTSATGDFVNKGAKEGDALVTNNIVDPTALTVATVGAEVVITVASTAGFPASGSILVGAEIQTYAAKTATTFTGLVPGIAGVHAIGTVVALINNANTYRVVSVDSATQLTIQRQDGSNFTTSNWVALATMPWRLHVAKTADTGMDHQLSEAGGYVLPARPLDATIANLTNLTPTLVPTAPTATSWDPLSGLTARTHPTVPGLAFDSAVQGVNAAASASLDALYLLSINSYAGQDLPERDVNILWSARTSANIRSALKTRCLADSGVGVGRIAVIAPPLTTQDTSTATGDTSPGVGAVRNERIIYSWPGARTFIPEAVNVSIAVASGPATTDGVLDTPGDGWLAAVMSNLAPERNPGQAASPVPEILSPIIGIQRGVTGLTINDYIVMRQRGVAGLIIDRSFGPQFQSGITTSLISGEKNINRRRFADFVEDSIGQALVQFAKLPLTQQLKDAIESEENAFCTQLLSPNNPSAQRIDDFLIDPKSGNTPDLTAQGIYVTIVKVRMTPTADFIVFSAQVGENVVITR